VSELLDSDTSFDRNLGLTAADEAFNMRGHMRVVGVEFQGARPRIEFWRPTLWDELINPWRALLAKLMRERNSTDAAWAVRVDTTILGAIENLLLANTLHEESVAALRVLIHEPRNYGETLNYLIRALRYVSSRWPVPIREELTGILLELNGATFDERLRRYVLTVVFDDDLDDDEQGPTEKASAIRQALAVDAVHDPMRLIAVLPTLLQSQAYHVIQFGQDLAAAAKDDRFDDVVLLEALKRGVDGCHFFLSGYLRGIFLIGAGRWERLADELLSRSLRWVGLAVACSGVSDKIFERLLVLHREGVMDNLALSVLAHDPIRLELGVQRTRRLIAQVLALGGERYYETAVEMADRSLCIGEVPDAEDENIVFSVLSLGAESGDNAGPMPDHHWGRLAKRFRMHFPMRDMDLFDKILAGAVNFHGLGYRRNLTRLVGQICELHPSETWKRVGDALLGEHGHIFSMWLGDVGHYGEPLKQAILHFKLDDILAWIAEDPAERALCIAEIVPRTLEAGAAGDLTRVLINRYGNLSKVGASISIHFRTGSWSGPESKRYSELRDRARKWLTETKADDAKIQDWLTDYIAGLNEEIERARTREERGF
jgi:hypothetical protein